MIFNACMYSYNRAVMSLMLSVVRFYLRTVAIFFFVMAQGKDWW